MEKSSDSLAGQIREGIRSGQLPEGAPLPSIREYEKQGFSRGAITRMFAQLRAEGLITSRQGRGNWVQHEFARITRTSPDRLAQEWWGGGHAIQDRDTAPRLRTVDVIVGDVVPPGHVASALGTGDGAMVLARSRRFKVDGRAVQLATSYLPTDLTRGTPIEHTETGPGGTYARLTEQGWGPTHFSERLVGRGPRPEEIVGEDDSRGLSLRRVGSMVFEITRYAYSGERCVEITVMVLDAEAYELVYNFPAE